MATARSGPSDRDATDASPRTLAVVLFDRFELLDVFGPLEMFGMLPDRFRVVLLGPSPSPLASGAGPRSDIDHAYVDAPAPDLVLVPGGPGTRTLVGDATFLAWLREYATDAAYVTSVCTGSALLAAAGLLDGYRATSNKRAFGWATGHGGGVDWIAEARWVQDRNRWTSSGVAAGMDMALALIAHLHGDDAAQDVADRTEYEWHRDATWDPFAAKNGLVSGL